MNGLYNCGARGFTVSPARSVFMWADRQHQRRLLLRCVADHLVTGGSSATSAPVSATATAAAAEAHVDAVIAASDAGARGYREDGATLPTAAGRQQYPPVAPNHYLVVPPRVHASAFVARSAELIGACVVAADANIWFGCVLRADDEPIIVGKGSNVQDGCVLHIDPGYPLIIGARVTIGHGAILHGCVIEDDSMVAIGATVLTGARVGRGSIIGAGAVVMEGMQIPPFSIVFGVPAKVVKTRADTGDPAGPALMYVERGRRYKTGGYATAQGSVAGDGEQ